MRTEFLAQFRRNKKTKSEIADWKDNCFAAWYNRTDQRLNITEREKHSL